VRCRHESTVVSPRLFRAIDFILIGAPKGCAHPDLGVLGNR